MGVKMAAHAALNGEVRTMPGIDKTLSIEGMAADAKAAGDAFTKLRADVKYNGDLIDDILQQMVACYVTPEVGWFVDANNTKCMVYGNVCTVFFDFSSAEDVDEDAVYIGFPKPANQMNFLLYNPDTDKMHMFSLYESGESLGVVRPNNGTAHGRYIGNITYIVG